MKRSQILVLCAVVCGVLFLPELWGSSVIAETVSHAGHGEAAGHASSVAPLLFSLVVILLAAKIGGDVAVSLGQPEVLGELLVGIIIGNLPHLGFHGLEFIADDAVLGALSELGVILLLFIVGLESDLAEMTQVGVSSLLVAVLGVVVPFVLGWGVAAFFVPDAPTLVHAFIGATLVATSVGITARVLKDLGMVQRQEAKIILGAAVIDDVLGLLVLALISGIITAANAGGTLHAGSIMSIVLLAVGFFVGALLLGRFVMPHANRLATVLRTHRLLLVVSLTLCFGLAYLAGAVGLAPIVGAFTAGMILDPTHYRDLVPGKREEGEGTIEELLEPITALLVPIFFVVMGTRVNLAEFANPSIIGFAIVLTGAAIAGKQICSLGVREEGLDRFAVGVGMIPRGEVGLIFAEIGAGLMLNGNAVIDSATYGAVVFMVVVTTVVTPPLLSWRFASSAQQQ